MDEICLHLFPDNWTNDITPVTMPPSVEAQRRMRRFVDDDGDRFVGHVSLISLFLALHNDSFLPPTTTAAPTPTDFNVTETPTLSVAEQISHRFSQSVLFGLLPTITIYGLIVNSLAIVVTASDTRCPVSWRILRCFAIVVDVVLLILFTIIIDVAAFFAITSLDVLNTLASLIGLLQYVQPWILYITATYVHHLLLDERHKVPPHRRVRCPLMQLIAMTVAGAAYFTIYLPPIRLLLYRNVARHRTLCTVPLFDQWQLLVGLTATSDLVYYLCYDCLYVFVVYLAPIVPLFYRYRRLVDAIFRRDYQSVVVSSRSTAAALGSWADMVSVTCGVHNVSHCIKSTLLTMRLAEAVSVEKYMAAGDVVFQLLNSVANVAVLLRSISHLPVMLIYDRRLRSTTLRVLRAVHAALITTVRRDDQSEDSDDSIELDSIIADDDALDDDDDIENAVPL